MLDSTSDLLKENLKAKAERYHELRANFEAFKRLRFNHTTELSPINRSDIHAKYLDRYMKYRHNITAFLPGFRHVNISEHIMKNHSRSLKPSYNMINNLRWNSSKTAELELASLESQDLSSNSIINNLRLNSSKTAELELASLESQDLSSSSIINNLRLNSSKTAELELASLESQDLSSSSIISKLRVNSSKTAEEELNSLARQELSSRESFPISPLDRSLYRGPNIYLISGIGIVMIFCVCFFVRFMLNKTKTTTTNIGREFLGKLLNIFPI
jgi:hypothetical protein